MVDVIKIEDSARWDILINELPHYDVYYLSGYVKAFQSHGDGEPVLIWWEHNEVKGACVLMIRDVALNKLFSDLEKDKYFDAVTPYGYGGFIFNQAVSDVQLTILKEELLSILWERNIISVFFRFHPLLKNAPDSSNICELINLGKTISMDLVDNTTIWSNITSKNRNMIRKAEKSGVDIHHSNAPELFETFKEIYDDTMRNDNAEEYYFFDKKFYESIAKDLKDNYEIFYATHEGKIISIAIMIFANKQMHYHLSGSLREYRSMAPSNLLLYKAALWGCEQGYRTFHLGGGVGSGEDPLYKFKAAFNRNSDNQFSIGKLIVNPDRYQELVDDRGFTNEQLSNIGFFPQYRAKI